MKILVLGAGAQGSAAAFDLLKRDDVDRVMLADASTESVQPFLEPFLGGKLSLHPVDARDPESVRSLMEQADACACALPYYFNAPMTGLAIECGTHFCDLGGNTEIVEEQLAMRGAAQGAGVSVVPDCGLAPGMVNILAQAGIDALDEVDSVRIWVGGLPQHPQPPLNYQIVYSMEGVLDYYTTPAIVLRDGEVAEVEPLDGLEIVSFGEGVGDLEAFYTAGGISTMPYRYRGSIGEMAYKTLRYPGHAHIMKAIRELGLIDQEPRVEVDGCEISPRAAFIEIVSPRLRNPEGDDLVALRVEVRGRKAGEETGVRYDLLDYYDTGNGITAMMRTTGYSLAITAYMQAVGWVPAGAHTPDFAMEGPNSDTYVKELANAGVRIERSAL
jgi:lysine 6-dehydrogenase